MEADLRGMDESQPSFSLRGTGARVANSRLVLIAGFGGLLVLMAFAGLDGIQALRQIQTSNDRIREEFLLRTRLLERIRGDVYVSGTYVRDYLLEPESGKAEGHRYSLLETRKDMDAALASYRSLITPPETGPFQGLTRELDLYWRVLEPVFEWTPDLRRARGYPFLRDEVFPRRMAMLEIADQIRALNEAQLQTGKLRVEALFSQYSRRLAVTIALVIGLGLLLAAFSIRKILALENASAASQEALQHLSARLVEAQEEERRSISRELHDQVGQSLTGVLLENNPISQEADSHPRSGSRRGEGRRNQARGGKLNRGSSQYGSAAAALDAR